MFYSIQMENGFYYPCYYGARGSGTFKRYKGKTYRTWDDAYEFLRTKATDARLAIAFVGTF